MFLLIIYLWKSWDTDKWLKFLFLYIFNPLSFPWVKRRGKGVVMRGYVFSMLICDETSDYIRMMGGISVVFVWGWDILPACFLNVAAKVMLSSGLCGLSCPCKTWWAEETSSQGYCVWQTHKPRCHSAEIPTQQALCCWGTCREEIRWSQGS